MSDEHTKELEPCPFCGVVPVMQSHTQEDDMDEGRYLFLVECGNGKCPMGLVSTGGPYKDAAKAAERWNSRASVVAPRKLTLPEINHLSALLEAERESGSYAGSREQYYARTERLIKWCSDQIGEK